MNTLQLIKQQQLKKKAKYTALRTQFIQAIEVIV